MPPRNASVTLSVTPRSRSNNDERLETRDKRQEEDPVSSLRSETPAGGVPRKPRPGYVILKAVMDALAKRAIPGPDEKLKRIVGGQITALLKGGYPAERVRHFAVELALSWDNAKGHQRLLGLRQAVLQDDADREYKAHEERKRQAASDLIPADPAVAVAMLNAAKRRLRGGGRSAWTVRCASRGCPRTALYATATCATHTSTSAAAQPTVERSAVRGVEA